MDFGALLDFAKNNELPNKEVKCYRTTFGPPKKEPKKCLSDNIRKFLARKEEEEKQKLVDADKKRGELLALRAQDSKANKRVRAMLKSTKAANKAVIDDARDDVNTAVTMAGPSQPDEDDYGYVSQEASAFYNKLMDKYSSISNNEPNFSKKSQSVKDLTSTKDRVRMALLKEEEEEAMGHKRKRRKKEDRKHDDDDDDANIQCSAPDRSVLHEDSGSSKSYREKPEPEVKKKRPQAPPPMDFAQLLKVAAQKQFEPIKIEKKEKDDEDRPMTKKQREEYLREKEHRLRKEERARAAAAAAAKPKDKSQPRSSETQVNSNESRNSSTFKTPLVPRIPKLNGAKANPEYQTRESGSDYEAKRSSMPQQTEPREGISSKQRMADMGRQGNARPPSREQEMISSEVKRNSMQSSNKPKDTERKSVQSVPSSKERRDKAVLEDRRQPTNQTSRPVIREEQRQSNQLAKTVVKEERPVNNQTSRPVVKEERRMSNQSQRPTGREESRPSAAPREESRSSAAAREPQKSLKLGSTPMSKPNRPPQSSTSTKPSPNLIKKTDSKPANPSAGDMLRECLTSASNQSLPPKNQQGSSQMVKKDVKTKLTEKGKSNVPPAETSLPKAMPNRPSATQPQGMAKERMKGGPIERRQEASAGNRRPPSVDDRRPSVPDRKPSSVAERGPIADKRPAMPDRGPATDRRPPPMDERRSSMADRRPPVAADRRPPSAADRRPPSMADRRPPSMADRRPPSMADRRPPSMGDRRPPSMGDRRPPSMGDRRPPSMGDRRPFPGRDARGRPMPDGRRRPTAKRRIESDDEYDSELEDFIDDGPEEEEDYSKYIKEIFGYDKARYTARGYEDEDEDECMESSFAQQMKEEFVSTKLGIMEDLEDIKKEQMEKMKKKMVTTKKKKL